MAKPSSSRHPNPKWSIGWMAVWFSMGLESGQTGPNKMELSNFAMFKADKAIRALCIMEGFAQPSYPPELHSLACLSCTRVRVSTSWLLPLMTTMMMDWYVSLSQCLSYPLPLGSPQSLHCSQRMTSHPLSLPHALPLVPICLKLVHYTCTI